MKQIIRELGTVLLAAVLAAAAGGCGGPGHPVLREESDVALIRICRQYGR